MLALRTTGDPAERLVNVLSDIRFHTFDVRCAPVVTRNDVHARIVVLVRHRLFTQRITFTPLAAALTALRLDREQGVPHGAVYAAALRRAVTEAEQRVEMIRSVRGREHMPWTIH